MTEPLTIITERVDDIPLLLAEYQRLGAQPLLDKHFRIHGNWQGLSFGWLCGTWLTHILSEADHRLNHVQAWAGNRLDTLSRSIHQTVQELDFTDDRLAQVLDTMSQDEPWYSFEQELNQNTLRVYELEPETVRADSTTATGYWRISPDGLFQLGHSKDHRPDLPQLKVMLATLDPLGMPLVTDIVAGNCADDPLYLPAIARVRQGLDRRGLLYVGDCKMAALITRATLHVGGDGYLVPLPEKQLPASVLDGYLTPVWRGDQTLTPIEWEQLDGSRKRIAEGYERLETLTAEVAGQAVVWTERRLVVRSLRQAQAQRAALQRRLTQAQAELTALNERRRGKKRLLTLTALQQAAEGIVGRYRVEGLVQLDYLVEEQERPLRRYRGRAATVQIEQEFKVRVTLLTDAVQAAEQRLGWRVYATNHAAEELPLERAVRAYRHEYLIERDMERLKGHPLSLTPLYLQAPTRVKGLVRLLSLGLRLLTLIEFRVRRGLAATQQELAGLYAGNPTRATARPTTERMLAAFREIHLTLLQEGETLRRHLTALSGVQQRILDLLNFPHTIYTDLCHDSS